MSPVYNKKWLRSHAFLILANLCSYHLPWHSIQWPLPLYFTIFLQHSSLLSNSSSHFLNPSTPSLKKCSQTTELGLNVDSENIEMGKNASIILSPAGRIEKMLACQLWIRSRGMVTSSLCPCENHTASL